MKKLTEVVWDGHARLFDMSVSKDLEDFQQIVDRVANGWDRCFKETERWVERADGSGSPQGAE